MEEALSTLEAELRERATSVAAALRPGLDEAQIQALLARFPHQVPPELVELYAWHDGTEELSNSAYRAELFPGGGWLPLTDALKIRADAMEADRQEGWNSWDSRWLPFTTDGRDGFHAVECGPGEGQVVGFYYIDLRAGAWREHAGLPEMIEALIRRWRAGVYWEADGQVDYDQRRLAALLRSEDARPPDVDQLVRHLATSLEPDFTQSLRLLRTRLYPEAVPALIAVLMDRSNSRHYYAIDILGATGDPAAIPALQDAAEHEPRTDVRMYAQRMLREFGQPLR